ncbi:MAG TPA: NAD(+)/NADH kinase [Gaiellaceae bacterium]|nr:NAD(+)/NADH kinase [Gaiellaceae bacterium]
MTSTSESTQRSRPVKAVGIVTHGRVDVREAAERVEALAAEAGVDLVDDVQAADVVIALGGDGTILRTLAALLGSDVPVVGVNYGRVGFLASIAPDDLERDVRRVLAGDFVAVELPTLEVATNGERHVAVNDVVVTSSTLGRMIELAWSVGGEDLGTVPCDGMICATPSGSTAYNLSNGGPVLVRGLDALAVTFIAPHSLHARPLVVPRGLAVGVRNVTADVAATLLVDGHQKGEIAPGGDASISLCSQRSLLATMPETTFFERYRETFAS